MMTGVTLIETVNFNQAELNSQFFTDIDQIIVYLKYSSSIDIEYLRLALENTKKNGYNILKTNSLNITNTIEY